MDEQMEATVRFCFLRNQVGDYDASFSIFSTFTALLLIVDLIVAVLMVICIWRETFEKRQYQTAKCKPVKLVLTPEYLQNLRPPKKVQPAPVAVIATPDELLSNKNPKKKSEKAEPKKEDDQKKDDNEQNKPDDHLIKSLVHSVTAKGSTEDVAKNEEAKDEVKKLVD
ncbi:hypothetical protein M3Y98_01163100 [Aphelenchoides besseyi]|nr:hypothetical protein M3Y98_01163100 [Aphelenchoides besseyi]